MGRGGFLGDVICKRNLRKIQPGEGREPGLGNTCNFRQRKDLVAGVDWHAVRKLHVNSRKRGRAKSNRACLAKFLGC